MQKLDPNRQFAVGALQEPAAHVCQNTRRTICRRTGRTASRTAHRTARRAARRNKFVAHSTHDVALAQIVPAQDDPCAGAFKNLGKERVGVCKVRVVVPHDVKTEPFFVVRARQRLDDRGRQQHAPAGDKPYLRHLGQHRLKLVVVLRKQLVPVDQHGLDSLSSVLDGCLGLDDGTDKAHFGAGSSHILQLLKGQFRRRTRGLRLAQGCNAHRLLAGELVGEVPIGKPVALALHIKVKIYNYCTLLHIAAHRIILLQSSRLSRTLHACNASTAAVP